LVFRGENLKKDSKAPTVSGIIELDTHPHSSKTKRLSSECYCPKKTRSTQEATPTRTAAANSETTGQFAEGGTPGTHDDREQYSL
jgi:hypothetical protein